MNATAGARRAGRKFFMQSCIDVAKQLLGSYLIRIYRGKPIGGKIVETEAYLGVVDRASHSYGGKLTERNKYEYLEGGHIYVYLCYGLYWQLNITTGRKGCAECVLIRALEPVEGISSRDRFNIKALRKLASGPGLLCKWMRIDGGFKGEDIVKSRRLWVEEREREKFTIKVAKRVGIDYAGWWAKRHLRFYIESSPFVSRK